MTINQMEMKIANKNVRKIATYQNISTIFDVK